MIKRRSIRRLWENIIGSIFALLGILLLLLIFLVGRLVDSPTLKKSALLQSDVVSLPDDADAITDDATPASPLSDALSDETDDKLSENILPSAGVYAIDATTLKTTMAHIDFEVKEKIRLEKEKKAAEKRAAEKREEDRRRAEKAKEAEEKRKAEKAKEAEDKRKAKKAKEAEDKRKAAKAKKDEEKRRAEKAKEAADKRKAAKAKEAADKRKAAEARKAAEKKAAAEAKEKADADRRAAEAAAKLASLNVGVPSLDGLQSMEAGGYGQGDVDAYASLLESAVQRYYKLPANTPNNLKAEFVIKIDAKGKVVDVKLSKSSGYPLFDDEARNAILAASPLPLPPNPALRDAAIKEGIVFKFDP